VPNNPDYYLLFFVIIIYDLLLLLLLFIIYYYYLLGVPADEEYVLAGKDFIHLHGGALYAPSWAKFFLAMMGVYHWDGINSLPAEMWFLPRYVCMWVCMFVKMIFIIIHYYLLLLLSSVVYYF
jgi:hypothetical protein